MVSQTHEVPHQILREDPKAVARMLEHIGIPIAPVTQATLIPADASESKALERRVDAVIRIDTEDKPFLVAVEVQLKPVKKKWSTWLYYCSYLQEKLNLPVVLLVLCPDPKVAVWARKGRSFGPPGVQSMRLAPVACGPHEIPRFLDREQIANDLPLAALSVITHATERGAKQQMALFAAELEAQPESEEKFALADLVSAGLTGTQSAKLWSTIMLMTTSYPHSPLAQALADQVTEKVTEEVTQRVAHETRLKDRSESLLRALELQSKPISDADRQRILECTDVDVLDRWFDRSFTVAAASELFDEA